MNWTKLAFLCLGFVLGGIGSWIERIFLWVVIIGLSAAHLWR